MGVVEEFSREHGKRSIVHAENDKYYCVDTALTYDHGWETMVFPYDIEENMVSDWGDLFCKVYGSEDEALTMHRYISRHIGIFVDLWEEDE